MMSVRRRDAVLAFFLSVMYNKRKSRGNDVFTAYLLRL